jgi:lia operon protein LiaF
MREENEMEERKRRTRRRRGSIVGPLVLIGAGVIFLLNTLGVVDWGIWLAIWRLWPILLIAAGLDILIGGRSALGSLVVLILTLALLGGGLLLLNADLGTSRAVASETIRQPRGDATQAEVVVHPAIGRLVIEALPESANLVQGEIDLAKNEDTRPRFSVKGDRATFSLRTDGEFFGPSFGSGFGDRVWDLGLAPDVMLDLAVDLGVGQADLDLTGLAVSGLSVNVGVGQTTVTLPREGDISANVGGAIGEIVIVIPEGMEARVQADTAIGNVKVPDSYQRRDDVYTSPGYARADNRVDLEVDLAIGSVRIRHAE